MHAMNQFIYGRERRRFGRQCLFSDRSQAMLSIQSSYKLRLSYILRNPVNRGTQLSDQKAFTIMETENVTYDQHGMYHFEGGWPREVNIHDEESTLRYRKKIEREDNWGIQVNHLIYSSIERADQNSAVNIYEEFFQDLPPELGADIRMGFEGRQMNIFHDPMKPVRPITNIDWQPSDGHSFLALHTKHAKEEAPQPPVVQDEPTEGAPALMASENSYYSWNQDDPLRPAMVYDAFETVRKAVYCPKDDEYIAGGFHSGKVALWSTRTGGHPSSICPLEAAHREAVTAICWVHSKSNTEFYTGSNDGSVKYWDGRDLNEPVFQVLLDPTFSDEQERDRAHGVAALEFEYTIPVRYIIASDFGYVFIGNRKGYTPTETLLTNYRLFAGPIRTVERNPFFVKNFLIVGDWCAKIWSEECKGAPNTLLVKKKNQVLCGTWSTARCSVFVTGDSKGELDFWDLLLHQRLPIYTLKLGSAITYVKFRHDGEYLSVGLDNGDIHMFELDEALKHSSSKEKALIAALFEREQLRSKLLEGRVEEIKLRHKLSTIEETRKTMEAEALAAAAPAQPLDPNDPEQFLQIIEQDMEFKDTLRNFKESIDKVDKKRQDRKFFMEYTDFEFDYVEEFVEPVEVASNDGDNAAPAIDNEQRNL